MSNSNVCSTQIGLFRRWIFKGYKEELAILSGYNVVVPVGSDVNNMIDRQNSSKIL